MTARRTNRWAWAAGAGALALLGWTSPGWAARQIVLQALISGDQQYINNIRSVFDVFEQKNPDIHIDILQTDDVGPKFRVMYAGGTPPDLLRMRGNEPAEFGTEGMIEELTGRIRSDASLPLSDFFTPALPNLGWNGRLYALPLGVTIEAMLYNKDLFSKAGVPYPDASWAWEREVIQYGKKMTVDVNGDGKIDQFFLGGLGTLEWFPFLYAAGGELFSADGRFLANSPAGAAALQFAGDLMNVHHITPTRAEAGTRTWGFEKGNIALNITGSWFIGSLRRLKVDFEWDAATVPTFAGQRATILWPETPWGIPSTARHKEEAWRVLRWIASPEGQAAIARAGLATPIRISVARSPAYLEQRPPEHIEAFIEAALAPRTRAIPGIPGWSRVYPALRDGAIYPVYDGKAAASQALAAVAPQIDGILKEIWRTAAR